MPFSEYPSIDYFYLIVSNIAKANTIKSTGSYFLNNYIIHLQPNVALKYSFIKKFFKP